VGVERMFPVHSPKIERIELAARGDVRRAKLYYLRDRVGKRARVRERRYTGPEDAIEPGLLYEQEQHADGAAGAAGAEGEPTSGEPVETVEAGAEGVAGETPQPVAETETEAEAQAAPEGAGEESAAEAERAAVDTPSDAGAPEQGARTGDEQA